MVTDQPCPVEIENSIVFLYAPYHTLRLKPLPSKVWGFLSRVLQLSADTARVVLKI